MAGRVRRRWGEEEGELGEEVVHPLEEGKVVEEEGEGEEGEGPASSLCLCRKKRSSQATTKQFY